MSIILDALKKAQAGKKNDEKPEELGDVAGTFKPAVIGKASSAGSSARLRTIVFAVVAILVLVSFFTWRFWPWIEAMTAERPALRTTLPVPAATAPTATPREDTAAANKEKINEEQLLKLKKEATRLYRDGQYEASAKIYKELTYKLPEDPEVFNNYGVALKKAGRIEDAKQAYGTALALNPDYPEALNNMAVIHILEREFIEAKRKLKKAIEVDPDYLDAYLHMALTLEKIGDLQAAVKYYEDFLNLSEGKVSRKVRLQIENRLVRLSEDI